ncbi:MAG: calcium/sodium antiporter [Clostridia bacterium]|nr:calcium/sodium antiporter [Clostridia bacterium]
MELFLIILLFVIGIVLVVKGGDYFVDASSWIAEVSGIPKLIIGATVVSIATTLPEMLVSVMAARDSLFEPNPVNAQGLVDISIGNAIGSVTANIGLIMAISLICMPSVINRKDYMLKSLIMLVASAIIVVCGFIGKVSILFSVVLLLIFIFFFTDNIISAKKAVSLSKTEKRDESITEKKTVIVNIIKFVFGAAGIVIGARLLVDNGSELARIIGIKERIIGVSLIAVGTSLPELITTITAISKKQSELSVGNIIGANIMDLTLIMPLSSVISGRPLNITNISAMIDLPACLLVGIIAIVPALLFKKFSRFQGIALLTVYIAYVIVTCFVIA